MASTTLRHSSFSDSRKIRFQVRKTQEFATASSIKAIRTVRDSTNGTVSIIAINRQGAVSIISNVHTHRRGTKSIDMLMSVW
jgi:hypothetical protein